MRFSKKDNKYKSIKRVINNCVFFSFCTFGHAWIFLCKKKPSHWENATGLQSHQVIWTRGKKSTLRCESPLKASLICFHLPVRQCLRDVISKIWKDQVKPMIASEWFTQTKKNSDSPVRLSADLIWCHLKLQGNNNICLWKVYYGFATPLLSNTVMATVAHSCGRWFC